MMKMDAIHCGRWTKGVSLWVLDDRAEPLHQLWTVYFFSTSLNIYWLEPLLRRSPLIIRQIILGRYSGRGNI